MIRSLQFLFTLILLAMLAVTTWASSHVALWEIPASIGGHPWFVATLFDAYFGFLTFYVWVAYKENTAVARILWLVAILCLGNIAMAVYVLRQIWRLPPGADMKSLLLKTPNP